VSVLDVRRIYTAHGVFSVDVERPVCSVLVIIGGDTVHTLDIQSVRTLLAFDQSKLHECLTHGGTVGGDLKYGILAVAVGNGKSEARVAFSDTLYAVILLLGRYSGCLAALRWLGGRGGSADKEDGKVGRSGQS